MHQAAQSWLVYQLTDSPFFLGLAGMAGSLPILLFTLVGGVIADRFPKRNIIVTTQLISMSMVIALAVLVVSEVVTIWHILIIAFLAGICNAVEIPTRQSFIIELVGREDLLNGIALNSTAFHGARMVGPAVAGLIMGAVGIGTVFFLNALSYTAIIAALLMMRFPVNERLSDPPKGVFREFREGLSYIFHHPTIYILLAAVGVISFFGFPYISFLPVYARDILKTGETGLGILMGSAGAGAFTGAVGLAIKGNTSRKGLIMAVAGVTFSAALLVFSVSRVAWLSYMMLFFVGFGAINMIATANSILQLSVPDPLRGRVMSSFTTMFLGMAPLGHFAVGSLAHYVGTSQALMIAASFCLLSTLFIIMRKPELLKM